MAEAVGELVFAAIGMSAAAAFTVGATTITLGTVVGSAVLVGGSIGLQMLLAPPVPDTESALPTGRSASGSGSLPPPESGHQALRQAIAPRQVGYGRVRVAGTYVFFEAKDGRSYDITALHHGRIGGFVGFYLHDDVVPNGTIGTVGGYVTALVDGRYGGNHVFLNTRLGDVPEQAYTEVTTLLPDFWTAAHRGDGIASMLTICEPTTDPSEFSIIFPRGKPEPSAVIDATRIYDPRDPAQSRANPATWKVSSNPVLQLLDYLTNDDYGMGLDWDELVAPVLPTMIDEANQCDTPILRAPPLIGEQRYHSDGLFNIDSDPADVVGAILDTCDGWISENGDGTLALRVGFYHRASIPLQLVTFAGKHIRGMNLQFDVADEEIVNELTIDYTEPDLDYKTTPAAPYRNEADIAERGRVRSQRLGLPWVQSFSQARRLAKRRDAQNNAELRGTLTTTLYGLRALGERWIRIQAPELPSLADTVIEVRGVTIDLLNAQLQFKFISIDEDEIDAWSPGEEGERVEIPPKFVSALPPPIDGNGGGSPTLNPVAYRVIPQGLPNTPLGAIAFDNPHRPDLTYQVQFRVGGVDPWILESNRPPEGPPPPPAAFPTPQPDPAKVGVPCLFTVVGGGGPSPGANHEVQIRSVSQGGFFGAWSASMFIQT